MKKRTDEIDRSLKSLDNDVRWSSERKEQNRKELLFKMSKLNVENGLKNRQTRKRRKVVLPLVAAILFLGIAAILFLNMNTLEKLTDEYPNDHSKAQSNSAEDPDPPVKSLKDMFVEEKDVESESEGMKDLIHVELQTNEELRYIIYVNTEQYQFTSGPIDRIEHKDNDDDSIYPDVAMEIRRSDLTVLEAMELIKEEAINEGMKIENIHETDTPLTAHTILAIDNVEHEEWDTPVHEYFIVDSESDNQVFIIKLFYFYEAIEGIGGPFDYMLATFETFPVIEEEPN